MSFFYLPHHLHPTSILQIFTASVKDFRIVTMGLSLNPILEYCEWGCSFIQWYISLSAEAFLPYHFFLLSVCIILYGELSYVVILAESNFLEEILLVPTQLISMLLGSTVNKMRWCSSSFNFLFKLIYIQMLIFKS